jgi:hypothetical protein
LLAQENAGNKQDDEGPLSDYIGGGTLLEHGTDGFFHRIITLSWNPPEGQCQCRIPSKFDDFVGALIFFPRKTIFPALILGRDPK